MSRRMLLAALATAVLLSGCGGGESGSTAPGSASSSTTRSPAAASTSTASGTSTPGGTGAASDCPTENTRAFAKTRFVADVGGALFLFHRYIYSPYQEGTFQEGAQGRRTALVKAGLAAAATAKLLANARENAKANPTLCRRIAEPLEQAADRLGGLAGDLASGAVSSGSLDDVQRSFGQVQQGADRAGIEVREQEVPLR